MRVWRRLARWRVPLGFAFAIVVAWRVARLGLRDRLAHARAEHQPLRIALRRAGLAEPDVLRPRRLGTRTTNVPSVAIGSPRRTT